MNYGFDWSQPSTQRGVIWLIFSLVGIAGMFLTDQFTIDNLVTLAGAATAGLHGAFVKDPDPGVGE
jgi:hypothetical protein